MDELLRQFRNGEIKDTDIINILDTKLIEVNTSMLGKITKITLKSTTKTRLTLRDKIKIEQVNFDEWRTSMGSTKYIQLYNSIITPLGDIIITDTSELQSVNLETYNREACDIEVIEITHDRHEKFEIELVKAIIIKSTTEETTQQLKELGLTPIKETTNTFRLSIQDLDLMLNIWPIFNYRMLNRYNMSINKNIIHIGGSHIGRVKYTVDNTQLDKMKNWKNKMKLLGILDDYSISPDDRILLKYNGISQRPPIPPVMKIKIPNAHELKIKELVVPDTVEILDISPLSFKNIDLSKATSLRRVEDFAILVKANKVEDKYSEIKADSILFTKPRPKQNSIEDMELYFRSMVRINPVQFIHCKSEVWKNIATLALINYKHN